MMTLTDQNLRDLLDQLTPGERKRLAESLREGAQLPADVQSILRWLKRRLKRRARARAENRNLRQPHAKAGANR